MKLFEFLSEHNNRNLTEAIMCTKIIPYVFLLYLLNANVSYANQLGILNNSEQDEPKENIEKDPYNRDTPKGTVNGFFNRLSAEDYSGAINYFDFEHIPELVSDSLAKDFIKKFEIALTKHGTIIPVSLLSNNPQGKTNDGYSNTFDEIGKLKFKDQVIPLFLEQVQTDKEKKIWLISRNTIQKLSTYFDGSVNEYNSFDESTLVISSRWKGAPIEDWVLIILIALVSFFIARLFTIVVRKIIQNIWQNFQDSTYKKLLSTLLVPLSLVLAVILIVNVSRLLELNIIVRQAFSTITQITLWLALFIFIWMLINALSHLGEEKLREKNVFNALSLISFFKNGAKFTLVIIAILIAFDALGFNITAGIAALGVGGIALALGAQKTVENLVGGLSVVFDQPVSVGDFCKFGETIGTVEKIGIRSTRIRTLSRTIVTIPNADFSSRLIENFAKRDKFLYNTKIGLRYETTSDQMRFILVELRKILYAHPKVDPDPARVRFLGYGSDSLQVEFFAYVHVADWSAFLGVQEDINFRIAKVIEDSGSGFAFPSQTLYFSKDKGLSQDKRKEAEAKVKAWMENGELQIPEFDQDTIDQIKNSLEYPPNSNKDKS